MEQPDVIIARLKRKLRNRRKACRQMNKAVQLANGRIAVIETKISDDNAMFYRLEAALSANGRLREDNARLKEGLASAKAELAAMETREASSIPAPANLPNQQRA